MATPTKEFPGFQEPTDRLLDPGPPRRAERKLRCKTFLWIFLILLGLGAGCLALILLRGFARALQNPHSKLYQDLNQPYRLQDVVHPLIDSNQTFDIVATVWLRTEQEDSGTDDILQKDAVQQKWNFGGIREKPIFSKTIFTGLTLNDKQLTTSVNFQVPTSIFKQKNLNNYDLRGSFVLVPTSTSLLDRIDSYSTWIPSEARYPPVRAWTDDDPDMTLKDKVIDSYGTFTPLLAFYNIKSKCSPSDSPSNRDDEDKLDTDDVEQDENAIIPPVVLKSRQRWSSTKGKHVLSAHPYIITRTFVGVADMTKVFNRQAYDNAHNKLRALSCGRLGTTTRGRQAHAHWQDCSRSYTSNGNQEVRIKVTRPTGKFDRLQTGWLYAPYVSASWNGWGPQDLLSVPVNREVCQPQSDGSIPPVLDEKIVNVTWNIAFSGRTPAKLQFLEGVDLQPHKYNMTDAVHKLMLQQEVQEAMHGAMGHRHRQTFHPRRKFVLDFINLLLFYTAAVLELLYWYTRSSTVGISISGTAILAIATILELVMDTACSTILDDEAIWHLSFAWKLFAERGFRAILMLKAITRTEIVRWRKTWIPAIHSAPATHLERSSQRLDSRMSWRTKAIIYTALTIFFTVIYRLEYYIILPRGGIYIKKQVVEYLYAFPQCALIPALVLGRLLQIVLNFRSRTFAGMYRATAYVRMMDFIFAILSRSPWIIGQALYGPPVTYFDLFELFGCCVLVFQSHRYPAASDADEEDNMR